MLPEKANRYILLVIRGTNLIALVAAALNLTQIQIPLVVAITFQDFLSIKPSYYSKKKHAGIS